MREEFERPRGRSIGRRTGLHHDDPGPGVCDERGGGAAELWIKDGMLRAKKFNVGVRVVSRSKSLTFQMAEVAVPRTLFATIAGPSNEEAFS